MTRTNRPSAPRCAAAFLLACVIAGPAVARQEQPPSSLEGVLDDITQPDPRRRPRRGDRPPNEQGPPPAAERPAPKPAPASDKPDRYFAITGATIHTVTGPVIEGGVMVCKNGKVDAFGPRVPIPEGAEVLDASGYHIFPGLVAVRSAALIGGDPPEDTTDCFSLQSIVALAGGITTVYSGNTAAKLTFGTVDDMIVKRNVFENIRYRSNDPSGKRRLREALDAARQYIRDVAAYEEAKKRDPSAKAPDDRPIKSGESARMYRMMRHESVGIADADNAYDIAQLCDLAEEYGIRLVVRGAREAWTLAPRLGRAGVQAIVTPRTRSDPDPRVGRPNGATIENAATLYNSGVTFAIVPQLPGISFNGLGGRDLFQLNLEAAFAVRGGLPDEAAVRAITIDAAKVLGIDDRVGSIEVGKDADFVIMDGPDLLGYTTMSRWTVVNGKVMYDKDKESLFRHIRPERSVETPAPEDLWPRRLGAGQ